MASDTQICNLAMLRLGAPPIISMDDDSKRALTLKANYELIRDIVLREHPWNFACGRAIPDQLTDVPLFGWSFAYQLPADNLRVLGLVRLQYPNQDIPMIDPTLAYEIEGSQLLTNESTCNLRYIRQVVEAGKFDPSFCSAFASRLAAEVCYDLTSNATMAQGLLKQYLTVDLPAARAINAQEKPSQVYTTNAWDDARI